MSEEENTEVDEQTDKEINFQKAREKIERLEARNAELEPLAVERAIREAGHDPFSPAGKALARIAPPGADADTVKSLAEELGFEAPPERPVLNQNERAAQEFSSRAADLASVTTSDTPPTVDDQIAEAYAEGNTKLARSLKNDLLANLARQAG